MRWLLLDQMRGETARILWGLDEHFDYDTEEDYEDEDMDGEDDIEF